MEMQQKPLVGIMHHILHKVDYNNIACNKLLCEN